MIQGLLGAIWVCLLFTVWELIQIHSTLREIRAELRKDK